MYSYKTSGTCATQIHLELDENHIIKFVKFDHGCRGNLSGISKLVVGMKAEDVIARLKGTLCRPTTSCPDQLAKALEEYLKKVSQ